MRNPKDVSPETPCDAVLELFEHDRSLAAVDVLSGGRRIGRLARTKFLEFFAKAPEDIFGRTPVSFLLADRRAPVTS